MGEGVVGWRMRSGRSESACGRWMATVDHDGCLPCSRGLGVEAQSTLSRYHRQRTEGGVRKTGVRGQN